MTIRVIDISYWQQGINYPLLAQQVDGVILRGAYGLWKDTWLDTHYENFATLGVPMGLYHYIIGNKPALEQARVIVEIVNEKRYKVENLGNGLGEVFVTDAFPLGIWNDVEDTREETALTPQVVLDYHNRVEELLETEMGVYTSASKWDAIMRSKVLSSKKLWVAHYGTYLPAMPKTGGWPTWWLHQYTDRERLAGYNGQIDANRFNGSRSQFYEWIGYEDIEPEPADITYVIEMLGNLFLRDAPNGVKIPDGQGEFVYVPASSGPYYTKNMQSGWYEIEINGVIGWLSGLTQWTRITAVDGEQPEPETPFLTMQDKVNRLWEAHPELH